MYIDYMYIRTWICASEYTCSERTRQIPLDLELQVAMICLTWVVGVELRPLRNIQDPNYRSGLHVTHPGVEQPNCAQVRHRAVR